jgi:DNA-binding MurR/RpiR family transcriptional regulator
MDLDAKLRQLMPKVRGPVAEAIAFILANRDEVPVRSMRELAKRANVPPVTLVRLAQRLGFGGFDEFREVYVDAFINERGSNLGRAAQLVSLAQAEGALGFAAKFAERELDVQRQAVAALKEKDLRAAARTLAHAERVFVVGRRPFFAAAYGLAYALRKARSNVHLLDTGGGMSLELDGPTAKDAFLGFTAYPYSRITLGLADTARVAGATVIAITDSESAPISQLANHVFVTSVKSFAFPDSISGAQLIAHILAALAVSELGTEALERVRLNELEIQGSGEYVIDSGARKQRQSDARRGSRRPLRNER